MTSCVNDFNSIFHLPILNLQLILVFNLSIHYSPSSHSHARGCGAVESGCLGNGQLGGRQTTQPHWPPLEEMAESQRPRRVQRMYSPTGGVSTASLVRAGAVQGEGGGGQCVCMSGRQEGEGSGAGSEQKEQSSPGDRMSGIIISDTTAHPTVWRYASLPHSRSVRERKSGVRKEGGRG